MFTFISTTVGLSTLFALNVIYCIEFRIISNGYRTYYLHCNMWIQWHVLMVACLRSSTSCTCQTLFRNSNVCTVCSTKKLMKRYIKCFLKVSPLKKCIKIYLKSKNNELHCVKVALCAIFTAKDGL